MALAKPTSAVMTGAILETIERAFCRVCRLAQEEKLEQPQRTHLLFPKQSF